MQGTLAALVCRFSICPMRLGVFANKKGEGQRIGHYHILDMGAVSGTYGHGCIRERHTHFF